MSGDSDSDGVRLRLSLASSESAPQPPLRASLRVGAFIMKRL